ncbi:hypothetical protein B0H10DRAFT_2038806 [Mycena sp. CBHHK59/15]|nr:hypothetical protein B0H10DRAFT_2038806 [Mycena sp. CBHHK59/15]
MSVPAPPCASCRSRVTRPRRRTTLPVMHTMPRDRGCRAARLHPQQRAKPRVQYGWRCVHCPGRTCGPAVSVWGGATLPAGRWRERYVPVSRERAGNVAHGRAARRAGGAYHERVVAYRVWHPRRACAHQAMPHDRFRRARHAAQLLRVSSPPYPMCHDRPARQWSERQRRTGAVQGGEECHAQEEHCPRPGGDPSVVLTLRGRRLR